MIKREKNTITSFQKDLWIHIGSQEKMYRKTILVLLYLVAVGLGSNHSFGAERGGKSVVDIHENLQQSGTITVSGNIIDEDGNIAVGVGIGMRGTASKSVSNDQGAFVLSNVANNTEITFSSVGYRQMRILVSRTSQGDYTAKAIDEDLGSQVRPTYDRRSQELKLTLILMKETTLLDETVVIGYQTVKRSDLTGSVSSVGAEDLKDVPINSAAQALAGRLAGVQVTSSEGQPGADVKIIVRGGGSITQSNEPLYIIDGIMVETGLTGIHPSDIEAIDVLKDAASTAIYGARGANGVVLVTTKGGKVMKTRVDYDGLYGNAFLARKLDVMDSYNFVLREYETSRGSAADIERFTERYGAWEELDKYKDMEGIDWQGRVLGRRAMMHTHNLRLIGGTQTTKFNIGFSSNDEEGTMINSAFGRQQLSFRFDHNTGGKLRVGLNARYTNQLTEGAGVSSGTATGGYYNVLRHTVKFRPIDVSGADIDLEDIIDEEYYIETNSGNSLGILHPVILSNSQVRHNRRTMLNLGGFLNYDFTRKLSARTTLGYSSNTNGINTFEGSITPVARIMGGGLPVVTTRAYDGTGFNISNVLNYKSTFGVHRVDALIGQEYYEMNTETINNRLYSFPDGIPAEKAWAQLGLGESNPGYPNSAITENRLLSFFGTANYSLKNKYMFTASVRADGSSKFASEDRWGYFPSGAFAWRMSDENFIRNLPFVSEAKLRVSYGLSGNNRIADYLFRTNFTPTIRYSLNEVDHVGFLPSSLANRNLTWETTSSANLGLDVSFFQKRLSLIIDAYRNYTSDLLVSVPIPSSSGYVTQLQNIGNTSNRGLEFQVNANVLKKRNLSWTTNFNLSFNRNRVEKLARGMDHFLVNPPAATFISGQPADYIVQIGKPVGAMYGFVSDGMYGVHDFDYDPSTQIYTLKEGVVDVSDVIGRPQPGWMKLKDLTGDGKVTEEDKAIIGNANPKFAGGLNQQLSFGNFDFSVFLNFVYGNNVYNANKMEFTNGYSTGTNMLSVMENRWKTVDDNGNVLQRFVTIGGQQELTGVSPEELLAVNRGASIWIPIRGIGQFQPTSWHMEDASYLRINNVTLGYTLPKKMVTRLKASSLRVYATVNNLHVFTNYSGYDPDVDVRASRIVTPGVDYSAYPRSRTYVVGVSLKL